MGFFILQKERAPGPMMEPSVPVKTTKATAIAGSPPVSREISMAIGAVIDLGAMEAVIRESSPLIFANKTAVVKVDKAPQLIPTNMGSKFWRNTFRFK